MNNLINIKKAIVQMAHYSKASHVASCLSVVEILYVLYFKKMNIDPLDPQKYDRDKLILSKGHSSAALYAVLAEKGYFSKEYLGKYYVDNGILPGHLDKNSVPGVEVSTGSLGHGLSIGLGMAIANRYNKNSGRIYVILGDGECNEGSVWEAVMLAATQKLDNLTVIVDYNQFQAFGRTNEIIDQRNMSDRWRTFGWEAYEVNGHNVNQLEDVFNKAQAGPKVIVAHTTKGKGVSFMENRLEWHYKSPNNEQCEIAMRELDGGQ